MIEITNLNVETNTLLIENMNAQFETSSISGISAPNGSGKSTLFRTICGLRTEEQGSIKITGNPDSKKDVKKQIFYFESSTWFNPSLTGMDYLLLFNSQWQSSKSLIDEAIKLWGMEKYIHTSIKKYSLGMKQKLLLSLYYISDATYWILDEPSLALDKSSVDILINHLKEQSNIGKCILFSAHESDGFYEICDHKYTIDFGVFKEL
ncbi:ABC transporter ATP-binding protein [Enterococcus casseliflavus]|uniref:ABC transporter ATP-binding protein n=1 Tax=Enterococcus casseliflavus TaxID=37734 RepID=A0A415EJ27_ENTCA|nr:ATP-binding cassette domain-containing protein [Enterococcus casseliflavus]MBE9908833.1 ABC transporter ATP-binding protein [Enterococcus casseliflavus]RHK01604.1 ABC transporter ATP-binding protein [Enterococcus casseliflavus]